MRKKGQRKTQKPALPSSKSCQTRNLHIFLPRLITINSDSFSSSSEWKKRIWSDWASCSADWVGRGCIGSSSSSSADSGSLPKTCPPGTYPQIRVLKNLFPKNTHKLVPKVLSFGNCPNCPQKPPKKLFQKKFSSKTAEAGRRVCNCCPKIPSPPLFSITDPVTAIIDAIEFDIVTNFFTFESECSFLIWFCWYCQSLKHQSWSEGLKVLGHSGPRWALTVIEWLINTAVPTSNTFSTKSAFYQICCGSTSRTINPSTASTVRTKFWKSQGNLIAWK